MKIALVTKLWEETSPYSVGGTGVAVGILANRLVERGHDVTLFATGDSDTKAKLISVKEKPWNKNFSEPIEYLNIAEAFSKSRRGQFDIIDCHVEEKACFFADCVDTPTLINVTYGEFGDEKKVFERYKHLNYVAISEEMKKTLPFLNWKGVIHHGIDTSLFPFNEKPQGDYLLFLGRISPQKGPHIAIQAAKKLGKKLILAGKMVDQDKAYLEKEVLPFIDNDQITYVGVANFKQKLELYKNAQAFLHPIQYVEAFGLTIIESLACGTPVISYDNGAPREIIENGRTGFVVDNVTALLEAISKIDTIARTDCRKSVEEKFSADAMTEKYEKLYQSLIS